MNETPEPVAAEVVGAVDAAPAATSLAEGPSVDEQLADDNSHIAVLESRIAALEAHVSPDDEPALSAKVAKLYAHIFGE